MVAKLKKVNKKASGRPVKTSNPPANASEFIESLIATRRDKIDRAISRYFPQRISNNELEFICGRPTYEYDVTALQEAVYAPGWDLLSRGGKRWRPLLMMLVIEALGKDPEKYLDFLVIPEVVHNGTLIIDDIEDGSEMRRNKPCVHLIYGTDIAVNAGNAMYFIPLLPAIKCRGKATGNKMQVNDKKHGKNNDGKVDSETLLDIYEIYLQEMINISHGQAMDIYWHRGKKNSVTVEQYLQMCAYKTGTLARMSAKIGARLAGANTKTVDAFGRFAESIAVAFQIQDDILNLKEALGKEPGEDIKEGKRSLLVIRALQKLPADKAKRLIDILNMHTSDKVLISEAITLIRSTDSFIFSQKLSEGIVRKSWSALDRLLQPSPAKDNLRIFAEYLILRKR